MQPQSANRQITPKSRLDPMPENHHFFMSDVGDDALTSCGCWKPLCGMLQHSVKSHLATLRRLVLLAQRLWNLIAMTGLPVSPVHSQDGILVPISRVLPHHQHIEGPPSQWQVLWQVYAAQFYSPVRSTLSPPKPAGTAMAARVDTTQSASPLPQALHLPDPPFCLGSREAANRVSGSASACR